MKSSRIAGRGARFTHFEVLVHVFDRTQADEANEIGEFYLIKKVAPVLVGHRE